MVAIEIFIHRAHCMETNKGFSERGEEGEGGQELFSSETKNNLPAEASQ